MRKHIEYAAAILAVALSGACNPIEMPLLQAKQSISSYTGVNMLTPDRVVAFAKRNVEKLVGSNGTVTLVNAGITYNCTLSSCIIARQDIELYADPIISPLFKDDEKSASYLFFLNYEIDEIEIVSNRTIFEGYIETAWVEDSTYFEDSLKYILSAMDRSSLASNPSFRLDIVVYLRTRRVIGFIYQDPQNPKRASQTLEFPLSPSP